MNDDIYQFLRDNKLIQTEEEFYLKKKRRLKRKKKEELLKKAFKLNHNIQSSDSEESEDYTMSERQTRITSIENIIDPTSNISHIIYLKNKYIDQLKDYNYISCNDISKMKMGGFIRYINIQDDIYWGGMIVKIINKKIEKMKLCLKNSKNQIWTINFQKYYIFYKKNKSKSEKIREIFVSNFLNK